MPDLKTEVTEIVTGLGMMGQPSLEAALAAPVPPIENVPETSWLRLRSAYVGGELAQEFASAWENGRFFLDADGGLRGRLPLSVAWKGPQKAVGYELVPADLRIDHVYLVSCKYLSQLLHNVAPPYLFDRLLAQREGSGRVDWYAETAPSAYQSFYEVVRRNRWDIDDLPLDVTALDAAQRAALREGAPRRWAGAEREAYLGLAAAVASESARRWGDALGKVRQQHEAMLWRLIRLASASYFVLGSSKSGPVRLRIGTPWDWRQAFEMRRFDVEPAAAGQPMVRWSATVRDKAAGVDRVVRGHVEVRWSHGRFSSVEAKVKLDTPPAEVPGYFPIG